MKLASRTAVGLVVVLGAGAAWAQPAGYVSVRKLAADLGLTYTALPASPGEPPPIVSLDSPKHKVMLYLGASHVTVDDKVWSLSDPVTARGGAVYAPKSFSGRLARHMHAPIAVAPGPPKRGAAKDPSPVRARVGARQPEARRGGWLVVVDPGHGGRDPGAVRSLGRSGDIREKDVVLDVARRVAGLLRRARVDVVMTRTTDVFVELDDRVKIANRYNPELFVSLHADAAKNSSASGSTVYYGDDSFGKGKADITYRARRHARQSGIAPETVGSPGRLSEPVEATVFGVLLQEYRSRSRRAGEAVLRHLCQSAGTRSRGVREADYRVVRYLRCPAVLVELDFLSHPAAARRLATGSFRQKLACGVADGVLAHLGQATQGTGAYRP